MSNIQLSTKQKQVASHIEGALLVLASAGSGKTRVLTERIKQLANNTKRKILAITFTNKASEEIKERLQEDSDILDRLFVGTFHSFCSNVLEKHGSAIGYTELPQVFSEMEDRLKIIEDAIMETPTLMQRYNAMDQKQRNQFKNNALEVISQIKREVILDEDLEQRVDDKDVILLYFNYNELMTSMNAIDFDDLLFLTYRLFISNPNIAALYRRNFEYICIDEAQDLNKAQYMVLRSLTSDEHRNVMLVGDPKQAIYGFNGSSSKYMDKIFIEDYNPVIIKLDENFRSARKVLELANKLIPKSSSLENVVIEGVCKILNFESVEKEANYVVSKIEQLLNSLSANDIEEEVTENRIAVLARNKYVLLPIEEKLKEKKIKYYYKSAIKGLSFDSTSGKIFNLALEVKVNPKDRLHISQLIRLVDVKDQQNIEDIKIHCSNALYQEILTAIIKLEEDGSNFKTTINGIISKLENKDNFTDLNDNELRIAHIDLCEIRNHWRNYERSTQTRTLGSFRNAMALGQTFQNEKNVGITLSTVHVMKGQESDIVFLVGMDDLTFPDYRAVQKGGLEMEQEKNNLYVAITRAKRHLYITYPLSRVMPWGDSKPRSKSRLLPEL